MSVENTPQNDHDLLIRLDEKLGAIVIELRDFKNDLGQRLAVVEKNKLDREEYFRERYESDNVAKDKETRIRRLERWGFVAIGALAVLQTIVAIAK